MADLRIYDFSFNLLFIESRIVSQSHTIYFNDIGKLEIHLAKDSKVTEMLFNNRYLLVRIGDICGIVTGVQIGKTCVIYAKTPNWILTKKVLLPFERTGNVEEILRRKVKKLPS